MPSPGATWVLTTARALVRPATVADAAALHWIRGTMPYDPQTRDLPATRAMLAEMTEAPAGGPGWRQFAVVARNGDAPPGMILGDIGVRFDHPSARQAELGFAFHPDWRGHGYATEAVGALIERLFAQGLHRLAAVTDVRNLAAQRLLTRLHFRQEAHYVASWPCDDGWSDELGYARLAAD